MFIDKDTIAWELFVQLASKPFVVIPWWYYKEIDDDEEVEEDFFNALKSHGLVVAERYDDHIKVERAAK